MKKLNSNHLKLIAIIAMTLDHIADLIYPGMQNNIISIILHIIGRLTAPIMFFFICEGFYYTKNLKKYILRLFIFAIISHFAYCFAFVSCKLILLSRQRKSGKSQRISHFIVFPTLHYIQTEILGNLHLDLSLNFVKCCGILFVVLPANG